MDMLSCTVHSCTREASFRSVVKTSSSRNTIVLPHFQAEGSAILQH